MVNKLEERTRLVADDYIQIGSDLTSHERGVPCTDDLTKIIVEGLIGIGISGVLFEGARLISSTEPISSR